MSQIVEACLSDSETVGDQLLDHPAWGVSQPVHLSHYWSGEPAPPERHAEVRAFWNAKALFVRFDCQQNEPLVVNAEPQIAQKTIGLWERDVCEIFIAPDANEPERYFEFEAAPTGEWLDLAIHQMPVRRETDWEYFSGLTVATAVDDTRVTIGMRIPFKAFDHAPRTGERWRANLFRCVGTVNDRGYLAWQPTHTEKPSFHVPLAFGWLCFVA